jgi:hypothetical protein
VSHRSGTPCQSPRPNTEEFPLTSCSRSKLAAGILGGLEQIYMKPGSKVLYLGAASGTSVSHVADIVGPTGAVFVGSPPKMQPEESLTSSIAGCRVLPPLRQRSYQHGCKFPPLSLLPTLHVGQVAESFFADPHSRPAEPTSSPSLRMPVSQWHTGCSCRNPQHPLNRNPMTNKTGPWLMSSSPMSLSPIRLGMLRSPFSSFGETATDSSQYCRH